MQSIFNHSVFYGLAMDTAQRCAGWCWRMLCLIEMFVSGASLTVLVFASCVLLVWSQLQHLIVSWPINTSYRPKHPLGDSVLWLVLLWRVWRRCGLGVCSTVVPSTSVFKSHPLEAALSLFNSSSNSSGHKHWQILQNSSVEQAEMWWRKKVGSSLLHRP